MKLSSHKNSLLPAALLAVLALSACNKGQPGAQGAGGQMPPAEVGVVTLAPASVALTTSLAGRTAPYAIAEIRPQVGGIIQQRMFAEGGDVKAGQTLYQIEPASFQNAFESAKAALARSEATLTSSRLKAERYKDLVGIKAVSQQDYDDADAALKQAEASVASDKAALDTARINLAYTRVSSPIPGRIGKSAVTQGALVTANQATALTTVQQLDPMYVDVSQSVAELAKLRRELASGALKSGAKQAVVSLELEDGSIYPLEGKLAFTDVTVDAGTGSVNLRAVFPNPKLELLPGMFVRARLQTGVREGSFLVPQQAVARNTKGEAVVMVALEEGKFAPRVVKTTQAIGDKWLVTEGVKAGDQVIVEGLQRLRPGTVIKAVPAGAQSAPAGAASAPAAGR
ncbi:efflux RND transporter periplasmic adaptor subunit [Uliginosibacterium aquaticum]|uniref:Efflux RND transporter periplasmic adaptor subunit n=1 Tax=Uliginosibacterium aquaticum TaxID=2731212 RepID=A0ABX2IPK1_9RHOO|nr:efflux RND transporter periplasmic adaptor subunit [Uliginosibacterium aquaticum]NSL56183.1 efflux RND transporter periplasmic adaptor subunit [Uliginosibacterium aquaticum]